jgi:hypothetical protein
METNSKFQQILQEIIPTDGAIDSLDLMFRGWVSSPLCGDGLTSEKERQEIAYHHMQIRQLLAAL